MKTGIYVHIPFCKSKCYYCDFLSFTETGSIEGYVNSLINEINENRNGIELVETVYIGGGTPTSIPLSFLLDIISALKTYPLSYDAEFTVEANPGTVTGEYLCAIKKAGVNRLSFGLQTTNNNMLKKLGRIHTYEEFTHNFYAAREAGFDNINIDLMYALPDEEISSVIKDLKLIIGLNPEHISAYPLTIEPETAFYGLNPTDEDTDRKMYEAVKLNLRNAGYLHYEISNFAKPGCASRHNLSYWQRKNYLGFGLGAHSFTGRLRYSNTRNLTSYINAVGNPKKLLRSPVWVSKKEAMEEFFYLGLRIRQGVCLSEFYNEFGQSVYDVYSNAINKLTELKLLELNGDSLYLTDKGIDISNFVFCEFLTASEQRRS